MGMFDYVNCEVPLPDGWEGNQDMQTKDLGCTMSRYRITTDGGLEERKADTEYFGDVKPHPYIPEWKNWREHREVNVRWEPVEDYHGDVRFYGSERDGDLSTWHEYVARFTDGKLTRLTGGRINVAGD